MTMTIRVKNGINGTIFSLLRRMIMLFSQSIVWTISSSSSIGNNFCFLLMSTNKSSSSRTQIQTTMLTSIL